jgi:hypothetical protein
MYTQVNNLKVSPYWKILTYKIKINHCIYTYITKTTSVMLIMNHLNLHRPVYVHIKLLFASFPFVSTPTTTNNVKLKFFKNIKVYIPTP